MFPVGLLLCRLPRPLFKSFVFTWFFFAIANAYGQTTPTLTVASSVSPSAYGNSVTFTATISSGPTGSITFLDGTTAIGTGNISGTTATYTTSALSAGSHSIAAAYAGNASYNAVTSGAISQTINKATPVINWSTPSPISYSTPLSTTQLDATTTTSGTFAYDPPAGTVLDSGSQTLSATFTPNDSANYNAATTSVTLVVSTTPPSGIITTVAGNGYWGNSGDGGPATSAQLSIPTSVVVDSAGNVYCADGYYNVIRKVTRSTGIISTVVGNGTPGFSGDGGLATLAQIQRPEGLALDAAGNLYISDIGRIRKVTASTGIISTVAGNGNWGYSGDGGPATSASLENNGGVAVDSAGNIYFTDDYNTVVREVSAATGIITTVAGNGTAGYSGDGGLATAAELNMPYGIAVDRTGNLYIADGGANVIRKVTRTTGIITTVAGNGTAGYAGDGGSATSAELNIPAGDVAVDPLGNIYIADSGNNVIRMIAASTGVISTIAGNSTGGFAGDGSLAVNAELNSPEGLALDSAGNIYFAEFQNDRVRVVGSVVQEPVTTMPTITWAHPASINYGTPLSSTQLDATASVQGTFSYQPTAGAILPSGLQALTAMFTPADQSSYSIALATVPLTVNAATPTITWPTPAPLPYGVPLGTGQLNATANVPGTFSYDPGAGTILSPGTYTLNATFTPDDTAGYSSASASVSLTVSILPGSGIIATLAGNGYWGYTGDGGPAINADLSRARGVAIDAAGNIYFADELNSVVRKVTASSRTISTVAGNGTSGYSGDNGSATTAQLGDPLGIALDSAGNIYIADALYGVIRKVSASTGIITTVAGNGVRADSGDGGPATSAELCDVDGVAVDSAGNIYIADTGNNRIRKVDASTGIINTIAGSHVAGYSGDGGPATSALLNEPYDVSLDSAGNLYISDNGNNVIRRISTSGAITTVAGTGALGFAGDGGPATAAELNSPRGIAIDSAGNIYLADEQNCVIRQVSASSGKIATVAGSGCSGFSGDGGSAISAQLSYPSGVAVDVAGNIYIGDSVNLRVRVVGTSTGSTGSVSISPVSATLRPGQQLSFTATVTGLSNTAVTWSITPSLGAITQSGQYTAPATISSQQTVTVTATSQADPTASASAVVTLLPAVTVSVTPSSQSLYAAQTVQFSANVSNTSNTGVTWSISPTGAGTIDTSGSYTAPATITTAATVTVTARSQADTTKSASATIYLTPPCVSNGYSFVRSVVIDHTKVPNTNQTNFPFLFSTTDSAFKTTSNGGHVTNANGDDIIFTSDAAGSHILPFEQESYNPSTGAVIYWINVPTVSHVTDSVIYVWYGNSTISTSQANPSGVWNTGYEGVYHLSNGTTLSANDSTANGDTGSITGATATVGKIDGGASFGNPGYIALPNLPNYAAADFTISTWVNFSSLPAYNVIMVGKSQASNVLFISTQSNGEGLRMGRTAFVEDANASFTWSTNTWYYVALTRKNGIATFYVNGAALSTNNAYPLDEMYDYSNANTDIGGDGGSFPLSGSLDEFRILNTTRSSDWIATEYNNQSSPSTFYGLSPEHPIVISPPSISLYASGSQPFLATIAGPEACTSGVTWSMPSGAPGTLTANGVYSAPTSITAGQTVTITATSLTDSTKTGTATVTLLSQPVNPNLALGAVTQPPYVTATSQQFVATLKNQDGSPLSGIPVVFTVTGANNNTGSVTTDGTGTVVYAYTGSNSGNDSIQASANVGGTQVTSNEIVASWVVPVTTLSTTTVIGRFFLTQSPYAFNPAETPAFVQSFPSLNFDPPAGTIPGTPTGVDNNSRPFIDVTTDSNGHYTGTIVAQGNGHLAGVGDMAEFQAVFTGSFVVPRAGNVTFTYYDDDNFTLGIGNGASRVSGPTNGMPSVTPFEQLPAMALNGDSVFGATPIVVYFPAAGTYPFEIDYIECCGGPLGLVLTSSSSSDGIPTTGTLTLSPNSVSAQPIGGQISFTVLATDATGAPVPNLGVSFLVAGADDLDRTKTTETNGQATFLYNDVNPGTAAVQAVAFIDGMVTFSNTVNVPWTLPPLTPPVNNSGDGSTLSISISAPNTVILPGTLPVSATVSDSALQSGGTISVTWSQVSGPGTVTFTSPNATATTASFTEPGGYVLKLSASDPDASDSVNFPITVNPAPDVSQGWIGSPANGSAVSGIVPITVKSGESLQRGTLTFYPASNPQNVTVLNAATTGSGQIGTLDTTTLANGQYWITLQATDASGDTSYNLALVTVVGSYKPGRVTSTVTDLVVPAKGLAIQIQRTYDSLNAGTRSDFGYGWNLGTNVNLSVNPLGSVTFTLGGQRRTFYLTPQYGGFLPFYVPAFTPEPGMHGTLINAGSGCSDFFDYVVPDGSLWACAGGGFWTPPGYVYTDPAGTAYTMTASGQLQSIVDKNGNTLTITAAGITSSTGLSVPFVRDSSGRITKITDPEGNNYLYAYDTHGNLESVTYPNTPQASTYTYDLNHLYLSGTDFRNNPLPTTTYYASTDTDSHGNPLGGRLESVTDGLGEKTTYTYDLTTKATTVTYPADAGGNVGTATMVYDTLGDLLSSTDPLGHTTTNTYDTNQSLLSTTDPLNQITCYTYDSNGNRTSVSIPQTGPTCSSIKNTTAYNQYSEPVSTTDELNNVRTFNYDINFNPQRVTDSAGTLASFVFNNDGTMQSGAIGYDISASPSKASQFSYDADGNMASRTDALGRTTSYTYDSLGHKLTMVEPLPSGTSASAATTTYSYDAFGNLTQTSAPLGRMTSSAFDGNGNKISDTDARNNTTTYAYDALNRLNTTTYPTSPTTTSSKTYDFRGNVVSETDQAGHVTKHVYDLAGRQTSMTQAYGTSNASTTTYAYDAAGRKTSETDDLSHTTTYTYDGAGNLTGVSGVNGTFTYGYDNARNRISMTDGNNNTTQYQYDARKRLIATIYPDSTTKTNTYDGPGNLISVTDQNGNEVQYAYDASNQLQSVTQTNSPNAPNNVTSYGYSVLGDITGLTDANSHLTENAFDLLSQPVSKTLPDGSLTETRQYDPAGNLTSLTHFNGKTTTYTFDSLNRLLSRTPDPTTSEHSVSFTYTATGKRASMTDASGTTNYTYDSMDRLTQKATPEGTLNYTYDAAGHLASMTSSHTNGVSASYTYDSLNRLSTVVDARLTGNQTTTYTYDTANNVATVTYPNTVQTAFSYDELNRVKQLATSQTGYLYTFDNAGNRKTASELNGRSVSWNFDDIYRLTGETITGAPANKNGTADYGLDPVGNRQSVTSSVPGLSPAGGTFNADDELASETYDSDGNVTGSSGKTFTYDTENQLMSMNGSAVTIIYDGDGNRVAKTVNGVTTRYLVDDLNPTGYPQVVEELSGAGAVERQYSYGLQRISQNQIVSNTWTPSFYGYDGLGTVRQLTNSAGAITDTYDYDAFGNKINSTGTTPNNYLYRGEQFDSDLSLYYLRARYYNPVTGRFMSRDPENGKPIDPKTLHKYLYAGGDPINKIDPRGRALSEAAQLRFNAFVESIEARAAAYETRVLLCSELLLVDWVINGFPPWLSGSEIIEAREICQEIMLEP